MGHSKGGLATVFLASAGWYRFNEIGYAPNFDAGIALSPDCSLQVTGLMEGTFQHFLSIMGEKDDYTAPAPCIYLFQRTRAQGRSVEFHVIKGANMIGVGREAWGIVLPESRIDPTARRLIAHALGEEMVWAGRPDPAALMRNLWLKAVLVALVMFAAGIFASLVIPPAGGDDGRWIVFGAGAFGIAIAALMVVLSAGRKGSAYGLTRRRAILYLAHAVSPRTEIVDIARIADPPHVKALGDGKADVTIRMSRGETDEDTVFQAIADAEAVVALIQQLRAEAAPAAKSA